MKTKRNLKKHSMLIITEIEGTSEGTPKVSKMANKTILAGRGKIIRFGRKI